MAAAYECSISLTDDETFLFAIEPRTPAGAVPVWADYTYEYSLVGCGRDLTLTEGAGLVVDTLLDLITIGPVDRTARLPVGVYRHGFRMTEISSDTTIQHFDGTVTVTEGNFR